ncbi:MAG: hypothetical protein IID18_04155 [Nitrospinae bacterium]|nr:hypothetical protein [Nitrospinota bacterium]
MVNPVGDNSNVPIVPIKDFPSERNPSQEKDAPAPSANVSFSEEVGDRRLFVGDHALTKALKKEFNQVFELDRDKTDAFLGKLDRIFEENGLTV